MSLGGSPKQSPRPVHDRSKLANQTIGQRHIAKFTVTTIVTLFRVFISENSGAVALQPQGVEPNVLVQPLRTVASNLPTIRGLGPVLAVVTWSPTSRARRQRIAGEASSECPGSTRVRRPFWSIGVTVHRFTGPSDHSAATRCGAKVGIGCGECRVTDTGYPQLSSSLTEPHQDRRARISELTL